MSLSPDTKLPEHAMVLRTITRILGLSSDLKFILGEIASLSRDGSCWAKQEHFATEFGMSLRSVRRHFSELKRLNLILGRPRDWTVNWEEAAIIGQSGIGHNRAPNRPTSASKPANFGQPRERADRLIQKQLEVEVKQCDSAVPAVAARVRPKPKPQTPDPRTVPLKLEIGRLCRLSVEVCGIKPAVNWILVGKVVRTLLGMGVTPETILELEDWAPANDWRWQKEPRRSFKPEELAGLIGEMVRHKTATPATKPLTAPMSDAEQHRVKWGSMRQLGMPEEMILGILGPEFPSQNGSVPHAAAH